MQRIVKIHSFLSRRDVSEAFHYGGNSVNNTSDTSNDSSSRFNNRAHHKRLLQEIFAMISKTCLSAGSVKGPSR